MKERLKPFTGAAALVLAICTLLGAAMSPPARAAELTVGIVGDQAWSRDLGASYRIMEQGIALLMEEKPDVIVHTGDMVESSVGAAEMERTFRGASALLVKTGLPWYVAAGDHDVNPPEYAPDSPDRSREKLFLSLLRERLPVGDNLYYSFDQGGYHFVVLYSGEHLHTDPRWGNVFLSRVGDRQYEWLMRDLEANRSKEGIVVFVHHPLWYNRAGWSRVHRLLREYPVIAVVAGHFHYNQDEGARDGIRYLVVGATGGEIKHAAGDAGGVHHVTVMTLEGRRAVFRPIAVSPQGAMSFGSGEDMDRVQALDYAAGRLEEDKAAAPLFFKEGRGLVKDCASEAPARLSVGPLGNPLEVPLSVTVDLSSTLPGAGLVSAAFNKDACLSSDRRACVMKPSYGTIMANTSSVVIDGKVRPLWEGIVSAAGEGSMAEGRAIRLLVEMSFIGAGGRTLKLFRKTPEIPVYACPKETPGRKGKGEHGKR